MNTSTKKKHFQCNNRCLTKQTQNILFVCSTTNVFFITKHLTGPVQQLHAGKILVKDAFKASLTALWTHAKDSILYE